MPSNMQNKIKHVVVLMLENRSFDNLVGWLYENDTPNHFKPEETCGKFKYYKGLEGVNYANPLTFSDPSSSISISRGVNNFRVPNPDPNESFKHMNQQLFGTHINKSTPGWLPDKENEIPNMQGFLADYATAKCSNKKIAPQIMGTYTPEALTAMSKLATEYAISDNYHASSPTQTWPNRAFMHSGTSQGNVNNAPYFPYTSETIFNVFEEEGVSWKVYKSSKIIPSLTRIQMIKLWDIKLDHHFCHISQFLEECESGNLPAYSFIEPSFVVEKGESATSEHPPADVCNGDHFLQMVSSAVINSKAFKDILFIVNFDEHGGCPDHVPPNWTAITPDQESNPGKLDFCFNRYGVRVHAIFVSPYIQKKTVFRASTDPWNIHSVPYDHTSILAMLLDWKGISRTRLNSKRVQDAKVHLLDELLVGDYRTDKPTLDAKCIAKKESFWKRLINFLRNLFGLCSEGYSLTSLQKSIIAADAHYRAAKQQSFSKGAVEKQEVIDNLLRKIKTEKDMLSHFKSLQ